MDKGGSMKRVGLMGVLAFICIGGVQQVEASEQPQLVSESAILMDAKSGEVLYDKQGNAQMYPASLTKIATTIMALERGDLDTNVTITEEAIDVVGTTVFLMEDEELPLEQLVKGMLINSGNDASSAVALELSGSKEAFIEEFNEYLQTTVGLEDTYFTNPHGLFHENHVTTANDLATLTQYAMQNEEFREMAAIETLDWQSESWETTIINHHQLVRDHEKILGVKNGFVSQSGFTLSTFAEVEDTELVAITLNAPTADDTYRDTLELFRYGFENYATETLPEGEQFQGSDGLTYEAADEMFYTTARANDVTKEVQDGGLLVVKNDDQVVLEELLTPFEEQTVQAKSENKESEDTSFSLFNWIKDLWPW